MIHAISKSDARAISENAKLGNGKCLGLPEMASSDWDFDRDYAAARMWCRFCLDFVFPKEATHIVLGWRRKNGERNLLKNPEVYTDGGFDDFTGFAARNEFSVVYAVHAH